MRISPTCLSALCLVSMLAMTPQAYGYVRTLTCDPTGFTAQRNCAPDEEAKSIAWPNPCVTYFLNIEGSDDFEKRSRRELDEALLNAVTASAETWNQPSCVGLSLVFGGLTCNTGIGFSSKVVRGGNMNTVLWRESSWPHSKSAIAITTVTSRVETGQIRDADIEMNGFHYRFGILDGPGSTRMDVQNTLTHEFGHLLGLDHELNTEAATMFPSANPGEVFKRDLDQDDINGLCEIYPFDGKLTCDAQVLEDESCVVRLEGAIGCASVEGATPTRSAPALLLMMLGLVFGCAIGGRRLHLLTKAQDPR